MTISLLDKLSPRPELVGLQIRTGQNATQGGGASVTNYRGGPSGSEGIGSQDEAAGMGYLTRIICFNGPANGYHASMGFPFVGRALGILFTRFAQSYGITVLIDGVPFDVPVDQIHTETANSTTSDQAMALVTTALDDGHHWARVFVSPDPAASGAIVRQVDVQGILVERGAGYRDPPRYAAHLAPIAITAAGAALSSGPGSSGAGSRAVSEIYVTNTGAAQRVSLVRGTALRVLDLAAAGAAGDTGVFRFDPPLVLDSSWTIKDVNSASNYIVSFVW